MSTAGVDSLHTTVANHTARRASPTVFYLKSGIFDLNGKLVDKGRFNVESAREMQRNVRSGEMLIVTDLEDTVIRPFRNQEDREKVMKMVVNRAPFLITSERIVYVGYMTETVEAGPLTVGDLTVDVIDRDEARMRIATALKANPLTA